MGTPQPFADPENGSCTWKYCCVPPRNAEESREDTRSELMEQLREGSIVEGIVKNITDYGAFIDLGGVDGLLHVTDIS